MSRTLKWILGILAVLVVIGLVGAAVWFGSQQLAAARAFRTVPSQPQIQGTPNAPIGPTWPYGPQGYTNRRHPMWGPMMGERGFLRGGPFGIGIFFLGALLRLVIPLAILVIVAIVFYQLGKRAGFSRVASTTPPAQPRSSEQNTPKNE